MREIIDKPNYRALKTISERKQAFHDFVDAKKRADLQAKQSKQERDKRTLTLLFERTPSVLPTSRWNKVKQTLQNEPTFLRSLEQTRQSIFDDWQRDKQTKKGEQERLLKRENIDKFKLLLQTVEITVASTWADVQAIYKAKHGYHEDKNLQSMDALDCLSIYETKMKAVEEDFLVSFERKRSIRLRAERRNRDAFKAVLKELIIDNTLNIATSWQAVHSLVKVTSAYTDMLGQSGSSPYDLYMDQIAEMDDQLATDTKTVKAAIKDASYTLSFSTDLESLTATLTKPHTISPLNLSLIHASLLTDLAQIQAEDTRRQAEDTRRQEKKLRRRIDDFRYDMRDLTPEITIDSTWAETKPRVKQFEYFSVLSEENRVEAFDKYIRRLKEESRVRHVGNDEHRSRKPHHNETKDHLHKSDDHKMDRYGESKSLDVRTRDEDRSKIKRRSRDEDRSRYKVDRTRDEDHSSAKDDNLRKRARSRDGEQEEGELSS